MKGGKLIVKGGKLIVKGGELIVKGGELIVKGVCLLSKINTAYYTVLQTNLKGVIVGSELSRAPSGSGRASGSQDPRYCDPDHSKITVHHIRSVQRSQYRLLKFKLKLAELAMVSKIAFNT
ncbi:hypothetical protein GGTG_06837 [Gaeumannomyces tritici R3-111a-1]|uniref:Uncharacterized protein n=1 Tax=Gaeumannomyces tritici (strain R3-111a-1) TaxID=644352 RepID=J3NZZ0_GAET3|nr:hypothetical protein GGTG_06837 [Gaeumannomyces tritici R3-111a-1]EJT76923.1 hypothetical protein GGTG_06837 [Gaeumannomyces tritici R3-111a-1]